MHTPEFLALLPSVKLDEAGVDQDGVTALEGLEP
jgi:hypothetical protein